MRSKGTDLIEALEIPGYGMDEVSMMEIAVMEIRPEFIGEWGTNRGSSARIFHELCKLHRITTTIATVELPLRLAPLDRDHSGVSSGEMIKGQPIVQLQGDGVTEALLEWVYRNKPERTLFFLDGDHLKENVFREIVSISRMAPKATMLLHDTKDGPGQAARDFVARFPDLYDTVELQSQAGMIRLTARNG